MLDHEPKPIPDKGQIPSGTNKARPGLSPHAHPSSHVPIEALQEVLLAEQGERAAPRWTEMQSWEGISLQRQRGAAAGLGTEPQGHPRAT